MMCLGNEYETVLRERRDLVTTEDPMAALIGLTLLPI
jgi:hypothetical protein